MTQLVLVLDRSMLEKKWKVDRDLMLRVEVLTWLALVRCRFYLWLAQFQKRKSHRSAVEGMITKISDNSKNICPHTKLKFYLFSSHVLIRAMLTVLQCARWMDGNWFWSKLLRLGISFRRIFAVLCYQRNHRALIKTNDLDISLIATRHSIDGEMTKWVCEDQSPIAVLLMFFFLRNFILPFLVHC